ncbi:MAG: TolC family protein [Bacteroidales bacterium]|nr:TolC family protein [Bacteroidales bacterium]
MKRFLFGIMCFCCTANLFSQKVWSLEECINYARQNNLSVKLSRLNDTLAQDNILTAEAGYYPSLSFSSGQNFTYTNDIGEGVYNGTYGLNANMNIYDGGKTYNNIKQKNLAGEIASIEVKQAEDNIMLSILQTYIQILYAKEAISTAEANLELSNKTLERANAMYKAGSISSVDVAVLESENASYNYRVIEAQNTYQKQKLELKQLMELTENIEIQEISVNDEDILVTLDDVNTIYNKALTFVPDILAAQKDKQVAELNVSTAKGGYLPNVSLGAGISAGHNTKSDLEVMKQLKSSVGENIGLNISVPIYDRRQTRNAVVQAKNQVLVAENSFAQQEKQLYKTIDELHLDCMSYQQSYKSAKANLSASEKSYNLVSKQFELGMKNIIELLNQRTTLSSAQQATLQAKYQALMKLKLLDYYQNKEIKL